MKPLRKKLIDELTLSGYAEATKKTYVRHVERLAQHYHRSPDQIKPQEVRTYLACQLREKQVTDASLRVMINALVYFYDRVLQWPDLKLDRLRAKRKKPLKRPRIYSVQEIERLLSWEGLSPKYRVFFMTVYASGLRLSEACHLRAKDLLADRDQIRVVKGKGKKDRYTVLFPKLLIQLRDYWRLYRPQIWLFPSSRDPQRPMCPRTAQVVFERTRRAVGLSDRGSLHALRHSFSTHLLELQVSLPTLQKWLGHSRLTTTCHYLHYVRPDIKNLKSPLDLIDLKPIKAK